MISYFGDVIQLTTVHHHSSISRRLLCNHPVLADGYFTTHPLKNLVETEVFYGINGLETPEYGYTLRLVAPCG